MPPRDAILVDKTLHSRDKTRYHHKLLAIRDSLSAVLSGLCPLSIRHGGQAFNYQPSTVLSGVSPLSTVNYQLHCPA